MSITRHLRPWASRLIARWHRLQHYLRGYEKVVFIDPDPHPELFSQETLWAKRLPDGLFRLENIPAIATPLNLHDVVRCERRPGSIPTIKDLVRRGGNRTLRVKFAETTPPDAAIDVVLELRRRGIPYEKAGARYLFNLGPAADYERALRYLTDRETEGLLWLYPGQ
jgi:hypothetical protein